MSRLSASVACQYSLPTQMISSGGPPTGGACCADATLSADKAARTANLKVRQRAMASPEQLQPVTAPVEEKAPPAEPRLVEHLAERALRPAAPVAAVEGVAGEQRQHAGRLGEHHLL